MTDEKRLFCLLPESVALARAHPSPRHAPPSDRCQVLEFWWNINFMHGAGAQSILVFIFKLIIWCMLGEKTLLVISNCTCTPQWSVPSTSKAWISLAIITLSMWTITSDFSHWEHQFTRCSPSPQAFLIKGSNGFHVNSPDLRGSPQDFVFPAHSCGER